MKRFSHYLHSSALLLTIKNIYLSSIDFFDSIVGIRPYGVPPRSMIFVGYKDYIKQGEKFLDYFRELGGLQPGHDVLDVGCEFGKMALPLTHFLSEKGTYEGFDSNKSGIDWCNKHISSQHPNFRFQYTGLYNQPYNALDKSDASNFNFPYENANFDFVFLTSLFTHMMPTEVEHYINEIGRVMKPGATILMSLFIVNCVSEDLMIKKPTHMNFPINKGFYRLQSTQVDTAFVAYDEEWLLEKLENAGLKMKNIEYGQWCGRDIYFDYKDLVICRKAIK